MMQAIILLGAPGAGKGTMADGIQKATDYIHVSTGDMLREAVKANSPVGLEAKSYMEAGELVPDDVIIKLVRDKLEQDKADAKYMFDGFPRTEQQARLLDDLIESKDGQVNHVFMLEVPTDIVVSRLSGRRICRDCNAVYHIVNIPPKVDGLCDVCGGTDLYQRPDDTEETILNRLDVYRRQTEQLIDYYEKKNILCRIDAAKDKDLTIEEIVRKL